MFNSQFANFFAVTIVLGLIFFLWVVVYQWKKPVTTNDYLLSESIENLTGIAAFLLSGSSIALSASFAIVLSFHPILTIVFVSMFLAFALVEFISSFHLSRAWQQRRIGIVFFAIWMMVGGVLISIIAGQAILQYAESIAKSERLKQNEKFEAFIARRNTANQRVKELAITDSEIQNAKNSLVTLKNSKKTVQKKLDACPYNWKTKCIEPNTYKLQKIEENIAVQKGIVKQGNEYRKARIIADELNKTPLDAVPGTDEASPGIEALAIVLGSDSKIVGAYVFFALAIFCEISALISFFLWGQSRHERALSMGTGRVLEGNGQIVLNDNLLLKLQDILSQHDNAHNVYKKTPKPIDTPPDDTTNNTQNVGEQPQIVVDDFLRMTFEKVKKDIFGGILENPSFTNLQRGYKITQAQAKEIRNMLLKVKACVKDSTGKLIPVPK